MGSTWQAAVPELVGGTRERLREDGEFILYRNQSRTSIDGAVHSVLVVAPVWEHAAPRSLRRMEHEYSLREELDTAWAVRPIALAQHHGRPVLVLEDPGGESLDGLIGTPMELGQFLRLSIGLSAALGAGTPARPHSQGHQARPRSRKTLPPARYG